MLAITAGAFLLVTWVATKGLFFFLQESPSGEPRSKHSPWAYKMATPEEQAELRAWMRDT